MNIERKFKSCCSFDEIKNGECFEKLFDHSATPGNEVIETDFDGGNIYIKVYQFVTDVELFSNYCHGIMANAVNLKTGMPARFNDDEVIGRVNAKLFVE